MKYYLPKKALIISFLASLLFPLLIFLFLSPLIDRAVVSESKEEAFRVADYLGSKLDLNAENVALKATYERMAHEIESINRSFGLYETCIISSEGAIVYSSREEQQDTVVRKDVFSKLLREGQRHAAFRKKGELSLEGFLLQSTVIESYTPILEGGKALGLLAVFYDISGVLSEMNMLKSIFGLILFLMSFGVMLLVSVYIVRAERSRLHRSRAEEALEEEQIKAEAVFSSMGDNVIIQDRDYKVTYQNLINREMYGDRRGQYCHKVYEGLDHVCPDCPVELTYRDGGIHKTEKEVRTPQGLAHLELTSSPLRNHSGEIVAGIKVVRDITERKALEEQLRHVQKMEALGTLTSGISHEFNNLLSSIIGFSEMLLDKPDKNPARQKYINAIHVSGKKAAVLTKGLLAYSRKQISNRNPVSLNSIVQDMESIMTRVIGTNITVHMDLAPETPDIMADRHQIEQVIVNIITNARDAMPDGGEIFIRTMRATPDELFIQRHGLEPEDGPYSVISIRDTGSGMDKGTQEKIFEPFFTTKDVGEGTGLGLSIAYGIITQHGGLMEVLSTPGMGAEFRVYLV